MHQCQEPSLLIFKIHFLYLPVPNFLYELPPFTQNHELISNYSFFMFSSRIHQFYLPSVLTHLSSSYNYFFISKINDHESNYKLIRRLTSPYY